uniref:Uncharacterized protein n=1 Tax=Leptobrachium leishanense TaxID=445787 RepID=A0A8C5QE98_9ANUR
KSYVLLCPSQIANFVGWGDCLPSLFRSEVLCRIECWQGWLPTTCIHQSRLFSDSSHAGKSAHSRAGRGATQEATPRNPSGKITFPDLLKGRKHLSTKINSVIALFCRQYDIIKDNDSNNNKEKAKASSEQSTPERQASGLLRKVIGSGYCIRGQDVGMQWEWGLGASWIGSLLLYKIKGCE